LLVLLVAAGLGGWNYHRNWQQEQVAEGPRPYESYAVEDLQALRDAYSTELEGLQARFEEARRSRVRPKGDRGSIRENLAQFDETSRASTRIRDAAADVAARQDQIAELDRELAIRARLAGGLMKHIERLVSI
jgi:multidrug efflux pump subunit AcrA (membrane-fusion protein)